MEDIRQRQPVLGQYGPHDTDGKHGLRSTQGVVETPIDQCSGSQSQAGKPILDWK